MKLRLVKTYRLLNWSCLVFGLIGVWYFSESWLAVLCALVGSLHFSAGIDVTVSKETA